MQAINRFLSGFFKSPEEAKQERFFNLVTQKLAQFARHAMAKTPEVPTSGEIVLDEISLFVRQTKSWAPVEDMLREIDNNPPIDSSSNRKIAEWVKNWLDRISLLRINQQSIREKEERLRRIGHSDETNSSLRTTIAVTKERIDKILKEGKAELYHIKEVEAGEAVLSYPAPEVLASESCKKVISFLRGNWAQLIVFYDFHEVSLNDEILVPEFYKRQENKFPFSKYPCIQAIFDLQAICRADQTSDALKTTHALRITHSDLASESTTTDHKLKQVVHNAVDELNGRLSAKATKVIKSIHTLIESSPPHIPVKAKQDEGNTEPKDEV